MICVSLIVQKTAGKDSFSKNIFSNKMTRMVILLKSDCIYITANYGLLSICMHFIHFLDMRVAKH